METNRTVEALTNTKAYLTLKAVYGVINDFYESFADGQEWDEVGQMIQKSWRFWSCSSVNMSNEDERALFDHLAEIINIIQRMKQ